MSTGQQEQDGAKSGVAGTDDDRYLRNRDEAAYDAWLTPESEQSVRVTDRDSAVVNRALGARSSLECKVIYSIVKRQKADEAIYDREWLAAKITKNVDTVTRCCQLLAAAGLIEVRPVRHKSARDRRTGIALRHVPGNGAERALEAELAGGDDREALRERDRRVDAVQALVDKMRTASPVDAARIGAEIAGLFGDGGNTKTIEDIEDDVLATNQVEAARQDDEDVPDGYAELAARDEKPGKVRRDPAYQAAAREAYARRVEEGYSPGDIADGYRRYVTALREKYGHIRYLKKLPAWLGDDDTWSMTAFVSKSRGSSGDTNLPPTARCPHCGHDAPHDVGIYYKCSNPDCDRFGHRFIDEAPRGGDGDGD